MFSTLYKTLPTINRTNLPNRLVKHLTSPQIIQKLRTGSRFMIPLSSSLLYMHYLSKTKIACDSSNNKAILSSFDARRDTMEI